MKGYELIKNLESVLAVYGYWPRFHDGEIHHISLERISDKNVTSHPIMNLIIHGWEMTSEIDENGYYVLQKHYLVHFKFIDIYDLELDGFNQQNAVELSFELYKPVDSNETHIAVTIDSFNGIGGEFKARYGQIVSMTPCNRDGKVS